MNSAYFRPAVSLVVLAAGYVALADDPYLMQPLELQSEIQPGIGTLSSHGTGCDHAFTASGTLPQYTSHGTNDFCARPYDAICGTGGSQMSSIRNQRSWPYRRDTKNLALERVARWLGKDPATFTLSSINDYSAPMQSEIEGRYQTELARAGAEVAGPAHIQAVASVAATAKASVLSAIDESIPSEWPNASALRKEFRDKVNNVHIIKSPADAAAIGIDAETFAASTRPTCGADGMADNAFATSFNANLGFSTRHVIFLCPGFTLSAAGSDRDSVLSSLVGVIGHELGHHFDANHRTPVYEGYLRCLQTHHWSALAAPPAGNEWAAVQPQSTARVGCHRGEITADFWAARTVAHVMRNQTPPLNADDKLSLLRESFGNLCGSDDEGIHPGGRYRIEVILRSDAQIHRDMGCAVPTTANPYPSANNPAVSRISKPGCHLAGETADPLY